MGKEDLTSCLAVYVRAALGMGIDEFRGGLG